MRIMFRNFALTFILILILSQITWGGMPDSTSQGPRQLSIEECIEIALEMNHYRPASKYALEIAEAQHKQVLSSHFPQLMLSSAYTVMDQYPNNIIPASQMTIPPINLAGFPLELPPIDIPKQEIKLMDKKNWVSNIQLQYPLYTGGMIASLKKQSSSAIELAKQEIRRTDLQVIYDVKRYYYAGVLAREILEIGEEALARLEVTLELTESLYQRGSGRVKKTDYLKNKMIVATVRSLVTSVKYNELLAKAALINAMGLNWQHQIELSEAEIPYQPYNIETKDLVATAYQFNPDWQKMNEALKIFEAQVGEAKSGYLPKIALIGKLEHIENSYNYGMVTPENKDSWLVGIGLQLPLFSGFRTKNQVKAARAKLNKLNEQKILLQEGLALQVQHLFLQMAGAQEKYQAVKQSLMAAEENRSLTERAYQQELLEEKDLIEAQITESIAKAQYLKVLYDHFEAQAHLDFVVGKVVNSGQ